MRALAIVLMLATGTADGCDDSSDTKQSAAQEQILLEGTAQTGMPAIKSFRERKLMKSIIEMRDQADLTTYTYLYAENTGKRIFLCASIGFPLPASTQYTNPQKRSGSGGGYVIPLPQADPNGLFSPSSAEGTWVMCKDPKGPDVKPVYVEPRIITSPFPFEDEPTAVELPAVNVKAGAAK